MFLLNSIIVILTRVILVPIPYQHPPHMPNTKLHQRLSLRTQPSTQRVGKPLHLLCWPRFRRKKGGNPSTSLVHPDFDTRGVGKPLHLTCWPRFRRKKVGESPTRSQPFQLAGGESPPPPSFTTVSMPAGLHHSLAPIATQEGGETPLPPSFTTASTQRVGKPLHLTRWPRFRRKKVGRPLHFPRSSRFRLGSPSTSLVHPNFEARKRYAHYFFHFIYFYLLLQLYRYPRQNGAVPHVVTASLSQHPPLIPHSNARRTPPPCL